jgi:hypothetical protein
MTGKIMLVTGVLDSDAAIKRLSYFINFYFKKPALSEQNLARPYP